MHRNPWCATSFWHWCASQPLDIIALQEIGWNFNATWTSQGWHCTHSSTKHASILVLIRNTLARPEQIATASHSDGRFLQIRLFLDCTYNFIVVYQHAWNATKGREQLFDNHTKIWNNLQQLLNHIPQQHQMVLMDDFNTTLRFDPPHIQSQDERASSSTHTDRDLLQQLTRVQDLIALYCKHQYASTFEYGSHHSRIDYVFVRQHQVNFDVCIPPWIGILCEILVVLDLTIIHCSLSCPGGLRLGNQCFHLIILIDSPFARLD